MGDMIDPAAAGLSLRPTRAWRFAVMTAAFIWLTTDMMLMVLAAADVTSDVAMYLMSFAPCFAVGLLVGKISDGGRVLEITLGLVLLMAVTTAITVLTAAARYGHHLPDGFWRAVLVTTLVRGALTGAGGWLGDMMRRRPPAEPGVPSA
jgi:hypothetical protein